MPDLRDFCDRLWRGEIDTIHEAHPVTSTWNNREPEELDDGFLYIKSAASMNTIDTGDGLVMLDTGTARDAEGLYSAVRGWRSDTPLRAAVFSHHHVDHIFGVNKFDEEAAEKGQSRPVVYGQRHIPAHFDRYKRRSATTRRSILGSSSVRGWTRRRFACPGRISFATPM